MTPKSGHKIAWASFLLGILVSVAGNVAHATSDTWSWPEVGGSAFWPLALMLSIEILTRVEWVQGRRWVVARFAGLVAVAAVAAVLSYRHLAGLMTSWGEDWLNAHLGPLAVDGLMLLAATALLSISRSAELAAAEPELTLDEVGHESSHQVHELEPEPVEIPAAPEPAPKPVSAKVEPSKLQVVATVPEAASEEAARQAWLDSGGKLPVRRVAELSGLSPATAGRRIQRWKSGESYR